MSDCKIDMPSAINTEACGVIQLPVTPFIPTVLEGDSLYQSYNRLANYINNMASTYNSVMAALYAQLENLKNIALVDGVYFDDGSVVQSSEYNASNKTTIYKIKVAKCDAVGTPIKMKLGLAYNDIQNTKLVQDIWDNAIDNSAQVIIPALNNPTLPINPGPGTENYFGYQGIVIWDGRVVQEKTDVKYSIGFNSANEMKVYLNSAGAQQLVNDGIVNAFGISGILVENGEVASDEVLAENVRSDRKQGRLAIGVTKDGELLFVGNDQTKPQQSNDNGLTSEELAQYMVNYGAVTAVEICETASGEVNPSTSIAFLNRGESLLGKQYAQEGYDNGAYWYISRKDEYTTDSQKQISELFNRVGQSLAECQELTTDVSNKMDKTLQDVASFIDAVTQKLNKETQDRIAADNELKEKDTQLQASIDKEIQDRKDDVEALETKDGQLQFAIDTETNQRKLADTNIQGQVTTNKGDITTLKGQMETAQSDITGIKEDLNRSVALDLPSSGIVLPSQTSWSSPDATFTRYIEKNRAIFSRDGFYAIFGLTFPSTGAVIPISLNGFIPSAWRSYYVDLNNFIVSGSVIDKATWETAQAFCQVSWISGSISIYCPSTITETEAYFVITGKTISDKV